MNTPNAYKCRICAREGVAYSHPDCPDTDFARLHKLLVCDRCFDIMRSRRDSFEKLCRLLAQVHNVRQMGTPSQRQSLSQRIGDIRLNVESLARKYGQSVSHFYGQSEFPWDPCVVDYLMESPGSAWKLLLQMAKSVRQFLRDREPEIEWNKLELVDFDVNKVKP